MPVVRGWLEPRPSRSEEEQAGEDLVEQAITRLVVAKAGALVEELTVRCLVGDSASPL